MNTPTDDRPEDPSERLARSWITNADAWSTVVRQNRIESRRVATDAAILEAVRATSPSRVLDVGCGEGWLCRALTEDGVEAVGVDVSAPLIRDARKQGGGPFYVRSYEGLAADPSSLGGPFDAVVCNFSLLGDDLHPLLTALRTLCTPGGRLIVQTVHPWRARGDESYADGWRVEEFADFDVPFEASMPWYFRTLGSWTDLLVSTGWQIRAIDEPVHPDTGELLSLIVSCTPGPA